MTSAAGPEGCPADGLPELALVGRSNVGKSTLVNTLMRVRLARTSAAPGKTRLLNVYRIDVEGEPLWDVLARAYPRLAAAAAQRALSE